MTQRQASQATITLSTEQWFDIRTALKQAGLPSDEDLADEILRQLIAADHVS